MKKIAGATSIREKINRIVLAATLVSLTLAGLALTAFDLLRQWRSVQADLFTQADVLALASQAALSFNDPKAAAEYLKSLQAKPGITAAAVYAADGTLFTSYLGSATTGPAPTKPVPGTWHVDASEAETIRPVQRGDELIGYIYLRAEHGLLARLLESLGVLAAIMALSLYAGHVFSNRLQRQVTEPIVEISGVARQILRGDTHAARAEKRSNDEVGDLVEAFNAMLAELGARSGRLLESNRAKDRFLATLAHELRNPLAPLRTGLEILKKDPDNGPSSQRARAVMERQLVHMIHLIDDLLDIARVNTGKFKLERRPVSLLGVIESAIEAYGPGLDARGQRLQVVGPDPDVLADIDPVRMTQALGNLIGNASKYTQEGGEVRVAACAGPQGVTLSVRDNGIGIPPEFMEGVFDLFAQVKASEDQAQGGLGIGLFLVRSVVELHDGRVVASSEGLGRGSEFRMELPASVLVREAGRSGAGAFVSGPA